MSKPVSPYAIGLFMIGALVLLIAALMIFGGGQLLKKKSEYVIYFDSALNGLNIGAPVTLQGVQIGTVKEISLELDEHSARIIKPVVIQLDSEMVLNTEGHPFKAATTLQERQENAKRLIDAGIKAQLQTQSLLTGLLYVEFNFHLSSPLNLTGLHYKNLAELPAVPSTEDQIKNTAEEILAKIRKLPLEAMVNDLSSTLKAVREIAASDELKQNRQALTRSLNETEKLVATMNRNITPLLNNMNTTMTDTQTLVRQFTRDMKPVLAATQTTLDTANNVLLESKKSLGAVETLAAPDAPLWQSLESLRDAAQSTQELTDYLQRHPDSIVYGKE